MLPKAHLTPHSRMSGSTWVNISSWLSVWWRSFLYSFSVYSYNIFLISSTSVRFLPFLPFIVPIFVWNSPLASLEEICSISHSIVSLYFFALITEEGFRFTPCYSLKYIFYLLLCLLLLFFSQLFVSPSRAIILSFHISFSRGWLWSLLPLHCHKPPSVGLQALCLSDLTPWIYLSLPCIIVRDFI